MSALIQMQDDLIILMLVVLTMQVTAIAYCWFCDMWEAWVE